MWLHLHIRAFLEEIVDLIKSYYSGSYRGQIEAQISAYNSFDAMMTSTPGNRLILNEGRLLDFARPDRFILAWVTP
jgi:hypothetical protein